MTNKRSQKRGAGIKSMKSRTQKGGGTLIVCMVHVGTRGRRGVVKKLLIKCVRTKWMVHCYLVSIFVL